MSDKLDTSNGLGESVEPEKEDHKSPADQNNDVSKDQIGETFANLSESTHAESETNCSPNHQMHQGGNEGQPQSRNRILDGSPKSTYLGDSGSSGMEPSEADSHPKPKPSSKPNLRLRNPTKQDKQDERNVSGLQVTKEVLGSATADKKTSSNSGLLYTAIFAFVVTFLMVYGDPLLRAITDSQQPVPEPSVVDVFVKEISELKDQFPKQNPKVWRIIRSTMKGHILEEDPIQPVVIMLVSTKKAAETREVLARKVAEKYSVRCERAKPVLVSGDEYSSMQHNQAKEEIDYKITGGFQAESCSAVISNFQRLPPASTTTFHQFYENDQAPFKKVAVIFTLEINYGSWDSDSQYPMLQNGAIPDPKLWDGIVDTFLSHSLSTQDGSGIMTMDMISGLLIHITPSVAWITEE